MLKCIYREEKANGAHGEIGMPSFRSYLEICKCYHAIPFIETKTMDIPDVVNEALEYFNLDEFIISSTQLSHLLLAKSISRDIFVHHIFSNQLMLNDLTRFGNCGISYNISDYQNCPVNLIQRTHDAGAKVCLRAADTVDAVKDMISMGLDYIPTNCISPKDMV